MKPEWRTSTVIGICERIRETEDYSALPILADALQDAGCDDQEMLTFLREETHWRRRVYRQRMVCIILGGELGDSVRWIDQWAVAVDKTYGQLMDAAEEWVREGEYTYDNSEEYKNVDYDQWPVFWEHFQRVSGIEVKDREATFYTCSC